MNPFIPCVHSSGIYALTAAWTYMNGMLHIPSIAPHRRTAMAQGFLHLIYHNYHIAEDKKRVVSPVRKNVIEIGI